MTSRATPGRSAAPAGGPPSAHPPVPAPGHRPEHLPAGPPEGLPEHPSGRPHPYTHPSHPHPHRAPRRRLRAVALALAAAGTAAAGLVLAGPTSAGAAVQGALPAGTQFYRDPASQVVKWSAANPGDWRQPVVSRRIASQPQGIWFANYRPDTVTSDVRSITSAAASAGQVPVLVVYEIPNRDCGGASAGGAPDLGSYDAWVRGFAAGLGSGRSLVLLEPDSLALTSCLSSQQQADRFASLSRAAAAIRSAAPAAKVYLDGGHSAWNSAAEQASRLRGAGVLANADGFFTNVSNFNTTANETSYAKAVLGALGNPSQLHAVVDTSRNGNGPAGGGAWCDPSGRSIGAYPTADTGDPAIDAYLWVKPPGEADGCAAAAGTFSPDIAYALASGAQDPPTSTSPPTTPPPTTQPPTTQPPTTAPPTGSAACAVTYRVTNSWAGGFTADVTVKNTGSSQVNGWRLAWTFPGDQRITNAWNATASQSGASVTAADAGYNAALAPGASTTLGFQATVGAANPAPTSFTLNGAPCSAS
ncbi:glycoside hydrolase family 6 protein [Streptacidiphilus sp. ASG 303]|uniref:glycoside hydrolase family 6 protein n=1 Tax=Streptacidiphilus sp. ASG 303 TaxID=2896847 RepID=UPI0027E1491F|nr:glycoside hydrolase family 6 protein [Streptacidiphilus sp. ASG 303]